MNWIILEPKEQTGSLNEYVLDLKKSIHIKEILKKTQYDTVKAIIPNKGRGKFLITEINNYVTGKFEFEMENFSQEIPNLPKTSISLIMPLPRPQTGKKILHLAGAFGVEDVKFLLPDSKNAQYLTSPVYKEKGIWQEVMTGMEQTGSYMIPIVKIDSYRSGRDDDKFEIESESTINIAFDPSSTLSWMENIVLYSKIEDRSFASSIEKNIRMNLFFGSESGFRENDLDNFIQKNVKIFNLGDCILRSEYAVSAVLFTLQSKRR
ncbi:16S rRNA (uracil(1498)-N(3))-methyltransferase [Leptospira sp. GIMC2001]|uniref:16S rRNA (uracil(1498)-N(3))-methyltransferase n=1 Tax=Leptospira sp. GIMC2001 TaxID=1513297 RepID=UPI00234A9D37|nr:16S rRNA (uracil(1498)-N(3))-methyltransferase [Leptospira sp. GIMC2001]WCL47858.1 16S rRNA (uracil(1498)-N(3))-methyltransferase [Leptospira sp. GIMC2001]